MNLSELNLWTKINDFQLDVPGDEFTFSDRVARENGWTKDYTKRVILEYKKFIYLCCFTEQGVTPSDPVDQVWHLHLTYTKSYWINFCQNTLGKQIHHNPTKGGEKEAKKFNNYYEHLKDIYRYHFDNEPPRDIWQPAGVRFSDIDFQRVNLKRYWLIRKPAKRFFSILVSIPIAIFVAISFQAVGIGWNIAFFIIIGLGALSFFLYPEYYQSKKKKKKDGGCSGCGGGGCTDSTGPYYADSGHHSGGHHHNSGDSGYDSGHSGCSSGCSGCSSSGCSGCGGGGD
jgi:hypothetical protein